MTTIARTPAVTSTIAALALGLSACAPDTTATADPGTPSVVASAEPGASTEPAPPTEPADATDTSPATNEPTDAPPADTAAPEITPADGDLPGAAPCYDNGANRALDNSVEVTRGAVRAWLCGDAPDGHGSVGPMEPLVTDVDAILDDFAALPDVDPGGPHAVDEVFRVVFEYADGSFKVLEGDRQVDGHVWAGGTTAKGGGEEFLNTTRNRWYDQRRALGNPQNSPVADAMACPAPQRYLVNHPIEDVVHGWICAGEPEPTPSEMKPEVVEAIAAELRDNSDSTELATPEATTSVSLMVAWGDATALQLTDDGFYWLSDQGPMLYTPGTEVDAELRPLLEG